MNFHYCCYLSKTPYTAFLREHGKLPEEAVQLFHNTSINTWGVGAEHVSLREALKLGNPGGHLLGKETVAQFDRPQGGFYPDGTASVARLLVAALIPEVSPGANAANIALARFETIAVEDLPERIRSYTSTHVVIGSSDPTELVPLEVVERRYILHVLAAVQGNRTQAARILGLDRKTLYRKLQRFEEQATAQQTLGNVD